MVEENLNPDVIPDDVPAVIAEPEIVIIAPAESTPAPSESSETINSLIGTIASLNDSINSLRAEIQGERAANNEAIFSAIGALSDKFETLIVARETLAEKIEDAPEEIRDRVVEEVNKPASRWL